MLSLFRFSYFVHGSHVLLSLLNNPFVLLLSLAKPTQVTTPQKTKLQNCKTFPYTPPTPLSLQKNIPHIRRGGGVI